MSTTPLYDFCRKYADSDTARLHMPGHKGVGPLGFEELDITEIAGADSLYEADGVIEESENIASELFGTRHSFYSAGGSSQSVKAMLMMACRYAAGQIQVNAGNPANHSGVNGCCKSSQVRILAGRNAHRAYVQAMQLIGFETEWYPSEEENFALCRCTMTPQGLRTYLEKQRTTQLYAAVSGDESYHAPLTAVYVTSPDYLGNQLDIEGLAKVAHEFGLMLLVDNAHGAYLRFLKEDQHPMTLGADLCADSAHKTLPALTGASYLHVSKNAPESIEKLARDCMVFFGSTSPSYLIMQSLDLCNAYLYGSARAEFALTQKKVAELRTFADDLGLVFTGDESMKLTLDTKASGLGSGQDVAQLLRENDVEVEYADPDYVVMMWAPGNRPEDYLLVKQCFRELAAGTSDAEPSTANVPTPDHASVAADAANTDITGSEQAAEGFALPEVILHPRDVLFLPTEEISTDSAAGRIMAEAEIGCPPAVSPVIAGERIGEEAVRLLHYYGIYKIKVIKEV